MKPLRVGVFGAGAIGASLGIRLSSVGVPVRMVARQSLVDLRQTLRVTDLQGRSYQPGADLVVDQDPGILAEVDVCLVTVKSRATTLAAEELREVLPASCVVLSLQNGLSNPARLRTVLGHTVCGGMVSYNVVRPSPGHFSQATKGPLVVQAAPGPAGDTLQALAQAFAQAGERFELRPDIEHVMAGKLLLNLNNGVCAAAGVTIAHSIKDRTLRRCFAQLMREGLRVMAKEGLQPRAVVGLPPWIIARVLAWPDAVVLRLARKLAQIDADAKSSTLQDLEAGKPTEIDDLCGEIVTLGRRHGVPTPANAAVVKLVHELEGQATRKHLSAAELLALLQP